MNEENENEPRTWVTILILILILTIVVITFLSNIAALWAIFKIPGMIHDISANEISGGAAANSSDFSFSNDSLTIIKSQCFVNGLQADCSKFGLNENGKEIR